MDIVLAPPEFSSLKYPLSYVKLYNTDKRNYRGRRRTWSVLVLYIYQVMSILNSFVHPKLFYVKSGIRQGTNYLSL